MLSEWSPVKRRNRVKFDDVADEVIEIYRMKSRQTFESFEIWLRLYGKPYFTGFDIASVAPAIPLYVTKQRQDKPKRKLAHDIKHLHFMLNHSVRRSYILGFPKHVVDAVDREPAPGREYSDDEIALIFKYLKGVSARIQSELILSSGCRPGEARCLRREFIDYNRRTITLPPEATKTRTGRTYSVPFDILIKIQNYASRHNSPFIFPNKRRRTEPEFRSLKPWQRCEQAILENEKIQLSVRPHWFRHTFATRARRAGFTDGEICRNLGMSPEVLNRVYVHPSNSDLRRMADVVSETLPALFEGANAK